MVVVVVVVVTPNGSPGFSVFHIEIMRDPRDYKKY